MILCDDILISKFVDCSCLINEITTFFFFIFFYNYQQIDIPVNLSFLFSIFHFSSIFFIFCIKNIKLNLNIKRIIILFIDLIEIKYGDWGLGIGDWGKFYLYFLEFYMNNLLLNSDYVF